MNPFENVEGFEDDDPPPQQERAGKGKANGHAGHGRPSTGKTEPRRFKVRTLRSFRKPEIPKLIHGLIRHRDLVLVYGGWGSGKSFYTVDKVCHVVFADKWRGRACDGGAAVYIAGEGGASIEARSRAWMLRNGKLTKGHPEPALGVISCAPDLLNGGDDLGELFEDIDAFRVEMQAETSAAEPMPIKVIVIDTVHSCTPGSREDAGDMGAMLAKVRLLQERYDCAVILVHHAGKDSSRGARGSNSLEAAADVIVEIVEQNDGSRLPIVRKLRDGESPDLEPFVIDNVTFDQDTPEPVRVGVHVVTEPKVDEDEAKKAKARKLRKDGESVRTISATLGVPKSTVARWCHD